MAAEIHKMLKGDKVIYPATITDAVVDPISKKSINKVIAEPFQGFFMRKGYYNDNGQYTENLTGAYISTDIIKISSTIKGRCYLGGSAYPIYKLIFFDIDKNVVDIYRGDSNTIQDFTFDSTNMPIGAKYFAITTLNTYLAQYYLYLDFLDILNEEIKVLKEPIQANSNNIALINNELIYISSLNGVILTNQESDIIFKQAVKSIWIEIIDSSIELNDVWCNRLRNEDTQSIIQIMSKKESGASADVVLQNYEMNKRTGVETIKLTGPGTSPYYKKVNVYMKIDWDVIYGKNMEYPNINICIELSKLNKKEESDKSVKQQVIEISNSIMTISPVLQGKNIAVFGDSISQYRHEETQKKWSDYFAEFTGANVFNGAVGGANLSCRKPMTILTINSKATSAGDLIIQTSSGGTVATVSVSTDDTVDIIASKIATACNSIYTCPVSIGNKVYLPTSVTETGSLNYNVIKRNDIGIEISIDYNGWARLNSNINLMQNTAGGKYSAYSNLDIPSMIYGFTSGDWSLQREAGIYLNNNEIDTRDFAEIIDDISRLSIDDADVVIIFGGTNNYSASTYGDADIDNNTVAYNLFNCVKQLLLRNPKLSIYILSPIVRYFGDWTKWDDNLWCDNHKFGSYDFIAMPTLCNKIEEVAKKLHVPYIDMYYSIGWNRWNYSEYFSGTDGAHPTKGFDEIGRKVAQQIIANMNFI